MNIKDFETHIEDKILRRGMEYYKSRQIESLDFDGDEWTAEVAGSDDYTVIVAISDAGDILSTECDCPYDWGEYCKHQAAVFYAIREKLKNSDKKITPTKPAHSLEDVLNKQDKSSLIAVLLEYAKQNKHIKDDLLFRFAEKRNNITYAQNLIKSSIKRVSYDNFVEYEDAHIAVEGADKVLKMAENGIDDTLSCVELCVVILREMMNLTQYCDDSDGYVGGVIENTIELMGNAVDGMAEDCADTEKIFDVIFSHAREKIYDGWSDWRFDIFDMCTPMCRLPHLRKRLEEYILPFQKDYGNNGVFKNFYDKYTMQRAQSILYKIIDIFDGSEAAEAYVEQNLTNTDFRRTVIKRAIDENRLDYAIKLCLDGEKSDVEYAGLIAEWKQLRYTIYEKQNDIEAQKMLATEFVVDSGKFEYYLKLKKLYAMCDSGDKWEVTLQRLLKDLWRSRHRHNTYVEILKYEKLKQQLLAYCENGISYIVELYPHLLPEYEGEVDILFVDCIRNKAEQASSRNHYRDVCTIIKHYKRACGSDNAGDIVNELLGKYPKRPAFIDELKKALK